MISRRLIRIKVFKVLFSRINSGYNSITAAEKELLLSCEKTLDLYYLLLLLPLELRKVAEQRIETGLIKFQPTPEEANPNRRFVNNRLLVLLENDTVLNGYCKRRGLNWADHASFVKKL